MGHSGSYRSQGKSGLLREGDGRRHIDGRLRHELLRLMHLWVGVGVDWLADRDACGVVDHLNVLLVPELLVISVLHVKFD